MTNNDLLKSLNAKQKKAQRVEVKTTTVTSTEVVRLKATKWDYFTTAFLIILIVLAVGFIIWTRNGYADNFTEQFQSERLKDKGDRG